MKNPHNLPYPKTNIQEILFELINEGKTSIFSFPYLSGFRTRVSEIQRDHGIKLDRIMETRCNKFSNPYTFANHILPLSEKDKAVELYNKLTSVS
jgi:hypothetical protein